MDFSTVDPVALLGQLRDRQDLFALAVAQMQMVDNFDNRMPRGLSRFSEFFYAHHQQVYAKDQSTEKLHRLFLKWLETGHDSSR